MTSEQNALICRRLAGYEVQVSPAGKYYIVTDEGTMEMPDFERAYQETITTAEAICRSRRLDINIKKSTWRYPLVTMGKAKSSAKTITAAIAHCLLQIAEGEE